MAEHEIEAGELKHERLVEAELKFQSKASSDLRSTSPLVSMRGVIRCLSWCAASMPRMY